MGKIKRGILGGFSGKVANVIGGSWKGIAYMRSMPLSVANPRTAGQVIQRNRLTLLVEVAKNLLVPIIKPLNDRFAQQMSGYNVFVQRNIDNAIDMVSLMGALNISEGSLDASTVSIQPLSNTSVWVSWVDNSGTGSALANDKTYIVGYNVRTGQMVYSAGVMPRNNGTEALAFSEGVNVGDTIIVALAFLAADGSRASNTVNFGAQV